LAAGEIVARMGMTLTAVYMKVPEGYVAFIEASDSEAEASVATGTLRKR